MKMGWLLINLIMISCATKNSSHVEVIAHRGASGYLPEHTLESYSLAHGFNVDYIEPDLVMTKDNELIILHDILLEPTTNVKNVYPNRKRKDGHFYAIDFTLAELKKLVVYERKNEKGEVVFQDRFPVENIDLKIPTFKEFVELIRGLNKSRNKNIGIYPEIKNPEFHQKNGKDITKKTIETLRQYGFENNEKIYIQCFDPNTLKRLKSEFKTTIPLIQLIADPSWNESSADYNHMQTEKGIEEIATYAQGIGPWINQLYFQSMNKLSQLSYFAKKMNLKIHPYTHRSDQLPLDFKTNDELFESLIKNHNIDGIFSDHPDIALKYLRE